VVGIADGDHVERRRGPNAVLDDFGDLEEHTMVEVLGRKLCAAWARDANMGTSWVGLELFSHLEPPSGLGANVRDGHCR